MWYVFETNECEHKADLSDHSLGQRNDQHTPLSTLISVCWVERCVSQLFLLLCQNIKIG